MMPEKNVARLVRVLRIISWTGAKVFEHIPYDEPRSATPKGDMDNEHEDVNIDTRNEEFSYEEQCLAARELDNRRDSLAHIFTHSHPFHRATYVRSNAKL